MAATAAWRISWAMCTRIVRFAATLAATAAEQIELARILGDRQNSDSTLTARLATRLVNALLDGGNTMQQIVRTKTPPKES